MAPSSGNMMVPLSVALTPTTPCAYSGTNSARQIWAIDCASELVEDIATTSLRNSPSGRIGSSARFEPHEQREHRDTADQQSEHHRRIPGVLATTPAQGEQQQHDADDARNGAGHVDRPTLRRVANIGKKAPDHDQGEQREWQI